MFATVLVSVCFISCSVNSGKINKVREVTVTDIENMEISGNVELHIVQGNVTKLRLEGNHAIIDATKITQNGGCLNVINEFNPDNGGNNSLKSNGVKVYLAAPNMKKLKAVGNVIVTTDDPIKNNNLSLSVIGNCIIKMKLEKTNKSDFSISGNSIVNIDYKDCGYSKVNIEDNSIAMLDGTMHKKMFVSSKGNVIVINNVKDNVEKKN